MTVTEDAPVAAPASSEPTAPTPSATGLASVLGTGDHKVVGRIWLFAAMVHLVLVGGAALWTAFLRIDAEGLVNDPPDLFVQADTFRSIGGAFLFLLPAFIGLATLVVPLQIGAPTVAFPRAAAAAAWTYLFAGGLLVASYAIEGGPLGTDPDGVHLFVVSFVLLLVALFVAWVCIATTVFALRAPGMTMRRVPLFSWSALISAGVWTVTLPVLAAFAVIAFLDIRYGGASGILPGGGADQLYARIAWVFGQPAVYAFAIPALGFTAAVVPVFSSTRHHLHRGAMALIGAYGILAAGAWAVPGYGPDPLPWLYELPWVAVSFAIVVPVLGLIGLWAATANKGRPTASSPMLFGIASALMLLVAVAFGAVQAIEPIETLVDGDGTTLYGTAWTSSVASYTLLAAAIAALGGIVFWAPKIIGRQVAEGPARALALLLLLGTIVWSFPDVIAGLLGQTTSPSPVPADNADTIEALNTISAIGGVLLALAVVGFLALLLGAVRRGALPGDDPWAGHTLEWATSSPPPVGNFASLPAITSEAPLYDARHGSQEVEA